MFIKNIFKIIVLIILIFSFSCGEENSDKYIKIEEIKRELRGDKKVEKLDTTPFYKLLNEPKIVYKVYSKQFFQTDYNSTQFDIIFNINLYKIKVVEKNYKYRYKVYVDSFKIDTNNIKGHFYSKIIKNRYDKLLKTFTFFIDIDIYGETSIIMDPNIDSNIYLKNISYQIYNILLMIFPKLNIRPNYIPEKYYIFNHPMATTQDNNEEKKVFYQLKKDEFDLKLDNYLDSFVLNLTKPNRWIKSLYSKKGGYFKNIISFNNFSRSLMIEDELFNYHIVIMYIIEKIKG